MGSKEIPQVDLGTFLRTLFNPVPQGNIVCLSRPHPKYDNVWLNVIANNYRIKEIEQTPGDWYVSSSLILAQKKGDVLRRKKEHFTFSRVLVLDDVGTKATAPDVMPTCILETSAGNTQWIYRLNNQPVDPSNKEGYARVVGLLKACAEKGYTDAAGLHPGRVLRVPGSLNVKHDPPFASRILHWEPNKLWTLEELAADFGVEIKADFASQTVPQQLSLDNSFKDVVLEWLVKNKIAAPVAKGWAQLICPWKETHTPGRDDYAGYKPLGAGENVLYRGFKCHHEHCKDKKTEEFLLWVYENGGPLVKAHGIDELPLNVISSALDGASDKERKVLFRESLPKLYRTALPDCLRTSKGEPAAAQIPTQDNLDYIATENTVDIRLNIMTRDVELSFRDLKRKKLAVLKEDEQCYRTIIDSCLKLGIRGNRKDIDNTIEEFSRTNEYHPFEDWILSRDWDGVSRYKELLDTVVVKERYKNIWNIYLQRWLIQGVQAALGWREPKQISSVLIFVGEQYLGKTEWLKALAPTDFRQEGVALDLRSFNAKDSIMRATMYPLVEIGEMDSTFRVSDVGALKNFLSLSHDVYRSPYGHRTIRWPRATSYFGSVNKKEFLVDETGSRRFWPVEITKVYHEHDIDLQQLWAEVVTWWKAGHQWWLTAKENKLREANNRYFQMADNCVELADAWFSEHSDEETAAMNATEFARTLGTTLNPKTKGTLSRYLDERLGKRRMIRGKRNSWFIPVLDKRQTYLEEVKEIVNNE